MSYANRTMTDEDSSALEQAAATLTGVSILSMLFGWTTLFRWTEANGTLFGVGMFDVFGVMLSLSGAGIVVLGIASYTGRFETTPDASAGLVTGGIFGLVGFTIGGLFASQTLGFGLVGWLPVALFGGGATMAATVLPSEDIGTTVPSGVLSLFVGLLLLGGVLTAEWEWSPGNVPATFGGDVVVPILVIFVSLVASWATAKAYEGFGSRGQQTGAYMFIGMTAVGMLAILLLVVTFVFGKGWSVATQDVKFGLFTEPVFWFHAPILDQFVIFEAPGIWFHWPFTMSGYSLSPETVNGVMPSILGTAWVVVGAVLFAVPLGVGAAVFLTEYAEQGGFTRVVDIATNGLWSTPSVVYGLFGYAFLVPRLGNDMSLLAGQLVLGFMLLPLVLITSREAIKTVPDEYRDASAALGVSQWVTIRDVVLPAAMPGVITGVILGVGRIAGETAPLILVMQGGNRLPAPEVLAGFKFTASPPFVSNPALLQPTNALTLKIYSLINSSSVERAWGAAFVLLLVVLSFYAVGISMRIYFRRKLHHE